MLNNQIAHNQDTMLKLQFENQALSDLAQKMPLPDLLIASTLSHNYPQMVMILRCALIAYATPSAAESLDNRRYSFPSSHIEIDPWLWMRKIEQILGDPLPLYQGSGTFFHLCTESFMERANRKYPNTQWRAASPYYMRATVIDDIQGATTLSRFVSTTGTSLNAVFATSWTWQDQPVELKVEIQTTPEALDIEVTRDAVSRDYRRNRDIYGKAVVRKSGWRVGAGDTLYQV